MPSAGENAGGQPDAFARRTRIIGLPSEVFAFGVHLGFIVGLIITSQWNPLPLGPCFAGWSRHRPIELPKIPGGTPLRLAMVHDVLHERYLLHGTAWYTQRNVDARKIIAANAPIPGSTASVEYLDALDDLAVGLQQTGQLTEAISILQKKLALVSPLPSARPATRPAFDPANVYSNREALDRLDLQKILAAQGNLSPLQHHQYTTCANLGTILLLDALPKVLNGTSDPAAKSRVRQSLDYIERAIAINPGGHFGREVWQAILVEHLLAAMDHRDLLEKYDMIGESLDDGKSFGGWGGEFDRRSPDISDPKMPAEQRLDIRSNIDRPGFERDWAIQVNPDYSDAMPFDEPTLAIIGMWTLGGGPNPHFSLTLGLMMESLSQNLDRLECLRAL